MDAVPTTSLATTVSHDDDVLNLRLIRKSPHTDEAYRRDWRQFKAFIGDKPMRLITMSDLLRWEEHLSHAGLSPASQRRKLSAVKSILSFAQKLNYLYLNPGAAVELPEVAPLSAERILTEGEVLALLRAARNRNDHLLLVLLYYGGLRVSEALSLRWRQVREQPDGSVVITVMGKGRRQRAVWLPAHLGDLFERRGDDDDVIPGRHAGRPLSRAQAFRIVRAAAERAGIKRKVSPHWLRHAHASHALARGATVAEVRDTLGHSSVRITDQYLQALPNSSSAARLPAS